MSWKPIQISRLQFVGPDKPSAFLEFTQGVNVVCGASETGKSFVIEALDFLLGAGSALRDIPERVGFDRAHLSLLTSNDQSYTLERSVEGGSFLLSERKASADSTDGIDTVVLKPKHRDNDTENISGWLLQLIGLQGKRLRKNKKGETVSLSFRNLAHLTLVDETAITRKFSPFLTGQFLLRTSEIATLKLLLTGVDDSSLVGSQKNERSELKHTVRAEVLDETIFDLNNGIAEIGISEEELNSQHEKLEAALSEVRLELERVQGDLNGLLEERRRVSSQREKSRSRLLEIDELLSRFGLLRSHYQIDLERLEAVQESGTLLAHQPGDACPLCGTPPGDQHTETNCDGNLSLVVAAASAEIAKVKRLSEELEQTVADLTEERGGFTEAVSGYDRAFSQLDEKIKSVLAPNVGEYRAAFSDLIEKREEVREYLKVYARLHQLEDVKNAPVEESSEVEEFSDQSSTILPKSVLRELSKRVSALLSAWHFPSETDTYFDEATADFVIGGKPRTSEGKGLRAITHAAASIALLEHCRENDLPHPGFLVLDSPLLAYWGPEGEADSLQGTDLKEKFYEYLITYHQRDQIIIIENEHVPARFEDQVNDIVFTRNPNEGRYGLFPR